MQTIPTTLTPEQAEQVTELLKLARKYLSDAASPSRIYLPNYAGAAVNISEVLLQLGVDTR